MTDLIVGVTENSTMTSLEIAELTWKRHDHILRDIDKMFIDLEIPLESHPKYGYAEQSETWELRRYRLDYDLTMTLISWYSAKLRNAIVKRWKELENQNKQQLPSNYKEALIELIKKEEYVK